MAAADGPFDVRALQQVVRKYFISSLGDDAALTLSSIYMDDYDFVGSIRMLQKIIDQFPDPSVSMVEVHGRLAICQALMGEKQGAQKSLAKAMSLPADSQSVKLADIQALVQSDSEAPDSNSVSQAGYTSYLANRNRNGLMPSLPSGILNNDLVSIWQYHYSPDSKRWADVKRLKPIFGPDTTTRVAETVQSKEDAMIKKWREKNWRPSGTLLFDSGQVYFKTAFDLTSWSTAADSDQVVWRSRWRNAYRMDDYNLAMMSARRYFNRHKHLRTINDSKDQPHEIQLFSDKVSSQMSIQDDILYSIEGDTFDTVPQRKSNQRSPRYTMPNRRSRTNRLTAYEAKTGRLLWTLPPIKYDEPTEEQPIPVDGDSEPEWISSGGFMSAPIHYAGLAIVAVNHGGAISAYGLDPKQNGKTVWSAFLCDESALGANPNAPVNLSIDGSDLFASCGLGVVFIIDPTTGLIRMARRYQRQAAMQNLPNSIRQGLQHLNFSSWSTDTILSYGRQMICFSSDAKFVEGFDRNTGSLIWRGEAQPLDEKVDYLLGVHDGILYAAGQGTLLAYNLREEGRMIWGGGSLFDGKTSYGRGMLTASGIYIPVEDEIYKFSLNGKGGKAELLGKTNVNLGTGAPVGNLYSDGLKIWVMGANRVYALGAEKNGAANQAEGGGE